MSNLIDKTPEEWAAWFMSPGLVQDWNRSNVQSLLADVIRKSYKAGQDAANKDRFTGRVGIRVKLECSRTAFDEIMDRVIKAGAGELVSGDKLHIEMHEIVLVPEGETR